jgi:DNA-directed RNA polymerase subunit RPC12/RpoP
MKPICVPCAREMSIEKNGFRVGILKSCGHYHQTINGDLWECPNCGARIVVGFGSPYYKPDEPTDMEIK